MPYSALRLDNITCTFRSNQGDGASYTAVKDAHIAIAPGEFVAVVGPTGCGKSTLLNVGAGLLSPSSGRVKVIGELLKGINQIDRASCRERVCQYVYLSGADVS